MALPTRGVKLNLIRLVRMQSLSNQKNDCRRPERWHNTHAHMRVLSGLSLMRCHRLALCKRCPLFVVFPSHTPEWHQSYSFSSLSVPLCNLLCAEGPYIELEIRWIFIFLNECVDCWLAYEMSEKQECHGLPNCRNGKRRQARGIGHDPTGKPSQEFSETKNIEWHNSNTSEICSTVPETADVLAAAEKKQKCRAFWWCPSFL